MSCHPATQMSPRNGINFVLLVYRSELLEDVCFAYGIAVFIVRVKSMHGTQPG